MSCFLRDFIPTMTCVKCRLPLKMGEGVLSVSTCDTWGRSVLCHGKVKLVCDQMRSVDDHSVPQLPSIPDKVVCGVRILCHICCTHSPSRRGVGVRGRGMWIGFLRKMGRNMKENLDHDTDCYGGGGAMEELK